MVLYMGWRVDGRVDGRGVRVDGRGVRVDGRGAHVDGRGAHVDGRGVRVDERVDGRGVHGRVGGCGVCVCVLTGIVWIKYDEVFVWKCLLRSWFSPTINKY